MFNDVLDVRAGNEQRKRQLQRLAQKMMTNKARGAGVLQVARAGGGLGRQNAARFRPLAGRNMGQLSRTVGGGRGLLDEAIGRFGLTERQPGAFDPGGIPDLGGQPGQGQPGMGGIPQGAGGPGTSAAIDNLGDIYQEQQAGPSGGAIDYFQSIGGINGLGGPDASQPVSGGQQSGPPAPPGYVNWQGQLIPIGVWKTMQQTGELF